MNNSPERTVYKKEKKKKQPELKWKKIAVSVYQF